MILYPHVVVFTLKFNCSNESKLSRTVSEYILVIIMLCNKDFNHNSKNGNHMEHNRHYVAELDRQGKAVNMGV